MDRATELISVYDQLGTDLARFGPEDFGPAVAWIYNPLDYAAHVHRAYLERYTPDHDGCILFLGMNPGPDGMAQTGIPFGAVSMVRDYLGLEAVVRGPAKTHPKKPVLGFSCPKEEPSGTRLWGLFRAHYPNPQDFFKKHIVLNYCPLLFLGETGRNVAAAELPKARAADLTEICDKALSAIVAVLNPAWLVGIGAYARIALERTQSRARVVQVLHPSPASPAANRGWAEQATRRLYEAGVWSAPNEDNPTRRPPRDN